MDLPERKQKSVELYRKGLSLRAVGRQVGVSGQTVSTYLEDAGEPLRPQKHAAGESARRGLLPGRRRCQVMLLLDPDLIAGIETADLSALVNKLLRAHGKNKSRKNGR